MSAPILTAATALRGKAIPCQTENGICRLFALQGAVSFKVELLEPLKLENMGTFKNGILGGFSGRVGNVVGSTWRGKSVMRVRPASVTNPNTDKQRAQRSRFGLVNRFCASHGELVKIGFRPQAGKQSAFNVAASYNLRNAVVGDHPDVQLRFADLKVSMGLLPGLEGLSLTQTAADLLQLSWTDNSSKALASSGDLLMVGLFDPVKESGLNFSNAATRADAQATLEIPADWQGRSVELYAFFLSVAALGGVASKEQVSDSLHGGSLALIS